MDESAPAGPGWPADAGDVGQERQGHGLARQRLRRALQVPRRHPPGRAVSVRLAAARGTRSGSVARATEGGGGPRRKGPPAGPPARALDGRAGRTRDARDAGGRRDVAAPVCASGRALRDAGYAQPRVACDSGHVDGARCSREEAGARRLQEHACAVARDHRGVPRRAQPAATSRPGATPRQPRGLDFFEPESWKSLLEHDAPQARGLFGGGVATDKSAGFRWALPTDDALAAALATASGLATQRLDPSRTVYIAGHAPETACENQHRPASTRGPPRERARDAPRGWPRHLGQRDTRQRADVFHGHRARRPGQRQPPFRGAPGGAGERQDGTTPDVAACVACGGARVVRAAGSAAGQPA